MKLARIHLTLLTVVAALSAPSITSAQETRLVPNHQRPKRLGVYTTFKHLHRSSRPQFQTRVVPDHDDRRTGYEHGERIDSVRRGSPAYYAGLERGDIIVATGERTFRGGFNYRPIRNENSLREARQHAGRRIKLLVINVRDGRIAPVTVYFDRQGGSRPQSVAHR